MRWLIVLALILIPVGSFALSVSTDAPCNVFVEGKPLEFHIKDAQGDVKYELVDYFGKSVAQGSVATGAIRIAGQKPCWYELKCTDEKGSINVSLGVVIDRKNAPLAKEGRIGAVACSAWLVTKDEYREPLAKMLRTIGMSWVREPLAWDGTEKEPGKIDWGVYQRVSDTLSAEGVFVNQGWTSVPAWSHPSDPNLPYPDDLRTLYRYLKTASKQYSKYSLVWDVLNEVELCWPLQTDTCAPIQKVSYLAIKAGNPKAEVLLMSFTHLSAQAVCDWGRVKFPEGMYENGVGDYFDIFNHHTYLANWSYPSHVEGHRNLMKKFGITGKKFWLTEAGLGFNGTDGPGPHLINKNAEQLQCRLVPMSATMGLVAGNEKYFWFCLPDYLEGGTQFAMLHPDITPYPSLIAMSACTNFIGISEYLGDYNPNGKKSVSYLFSTPKGNVLVAWSDKQIDLAVPTEKPSVKVADIFGAVTEVAAKNGAVTVKVESNAVYLLDVGKKILPMVKSGPEAKSSSQANAKTPSTVVLAGRAVGPPIDRNVDAYKLNAGGVGTAGQPFNYILDVYQFDEKKGASGTVEAIAPEGWIIENAKRNVKLGPMGRETLTFKITPVPSFLGVGKVAFRGNFNGKPTAPAAAFFRYEFNSYAF